MVIAITRRRLRDSPMTAHVVNRSAAERTLSRQFAEQERREPSSARAAAFARFAAAGLPTRRVEAWHYTDLRASMADASPILATPTRADIEAARSVLARRERFAAGTANCLAWRGLYRRAFGSSPDGGLRSLRERQSRPMRSTIL